MALTQDPYKEPAMADTQYTVERNPGLAASGFNLALIYIWKQTMFWKPEKLRFKILNLSDSLILFHSAFD